MLRSISVDEWSLMSRSDFYFGRNDSHDLCIDRYASSEYWSTTQTS